MAGPTAGVVAALVAWAGNWTDCPYLTWTSLGSFVVPNEDHEVLFVNVSVQRDSVGTMKGAIRIKVGSTYYPITDGSNGLGVFAYGEDAVCLPSDSALFTIPSNIKGQTVYVEYLNVKNITISQCATIVCWGHSAHFHR